MAPRRPRDIGTAFETAVVRYLRTAGFPHAERRALHGAADWGDITGTPGICWECKSGDQAKTASDGLIQQWLDETMRQAANASADVGILVLDRRAVGPANAGRWWAIMPGHQYEQLTTPHRCAEPSCTTRIGGWNFGDRGPLRMHLAQACALLTHAGYGTTTPALATQGAP